VLLIIFALGPTYMNAVFGQVNAFVLASAVAFVTLAARSSTAAAGVLAAGTWLKVYPALLTAIVVWDRRAWRAIALSVAAAVAIAVLLLPVVPWQAYRAFFFDVLPARIDQTAIHITNQSLVAFLERFRFSSDLFLYWTGEEAITVSGAVRFVNVVCAVGAIVSVAKLSAPLELKAASLMALVAVVAPLGWGHTYVMVLPLVICQLMVMQTAPRPAAVMIFACVSAFLIPAGRHLPIGRAPDWVENIVYSRYLIATVILVSISAYLRLGQKPESTIIAPA
jgi:hypothetical protein